LFNSKKVCQDPEDSYLGIQKRQEDLLLKQHEKLQKRQGIEFTSGASHLKEEFEGLISLKIVFSQYNRCSSKIKEKESLGFSCQRSS
jgi:hypothetical protein